MKVRELLTNESKWCQKHMVLDKNRQPCSIATGDAVEYCLLGALHFCYPNNDIRSNVSFRLTDWLGERITTWNDAPERTFAEVKQLVEELDI